MDASLDRALENLVSMRGGPPGVIAVVQRGDELKVHSFGYGDVRTRQRIRATDHMRIASVAKAFSGAAALSLVAKDVLSLGDTIGDRLTGLPAAWHPVTLRQLLNHTSGLPEYIRSQRFADAFGASPGVAPPPRDLLAFVANDRSATATSGSSLAFPPGSRYRYSNSDNIAVGLMVEAATGRPYQDVLAEEIYGPLGLQQTSLPRGAELPDPYIHGYGVDASEDVSAAIGSGWAWASGGIVSTPAELNRFVRGYVGGELFGPAIQAEQRKVVAGNSEPPGPGRNRAGLAVFRYETRWGTVYGHTGNTFGFTQFAAATPDGRRSVAVSINLQRTQESEGQAGTVFRALRRAELLAVGAALAGS